QTVCAASPIQTLTATATVSTGATLVWYDAASGGNTVANPTLSSIGTATYYAQANLGDCSSGRVPVVLTINATPQLSCRTTDVTYYGGADGSLTVTISNYSASRTYQYSLNDDSYVNVTSNPFTIPNLGVGNYKVEVKSDQGCEGVTNCSVIINPCNNFRTQTMGGWGAEPTKKGDNPGNYLHANFATAFPNGLVVGDIDPNDGCTGYKLTLTTAQAVTNFLPSSGRPRALDKNYVNPTEKGKTIYSNTFAGQVVALTISLGFDYNIASFSPSTTYLGDLIIGSGDFTGKTVTEVWQLANKALAGCSTGYSISQLNAIIAAINEHYVDGRLSGNILYCPPTNGTYATRQLSSTSTSSLEGIKADQITAYPTPFSDKAIIEFRISKTENYVVNLYDMKGALVKQLKAGKAKAGELQQVEVDGRGLGEGLYIARMISDSDAQTVKLLLKRE
ncbi:Ig-like domain-containing protein, partial [Pontibacter fetidus]